jgi:MFS transporter, MHS family, proline/betaine transporter
MTITPRARVVLAAAIGNVVEWYDFGLYGLLAPVLATMFFPSHDRIAALLGVYGGFAVGFAMRPIGAIVLGRIGDHRGRQFVLIVSVIIMGASTVAVGLLPSYAAIGIAAPILLIAIRLFQGFSVGGEYVGSVTYLVETAHETRRGLAGSVANLGATVGMLLGAAAGALTETQVNGHYQLWRAPFFFGGVLAFIGLLLRRHLPPEEEFAHVAEKREPEEHRSKPESLSARWPALEAFRVAPRTMVVCTLFTCGYGISNYITMVFLPTFGREFANISQGAALGINTAGQALALLVVPLAGWASDRWVRRRFLMAAAFLAQAALAWELFGAVVKSGVAGLWMAQLALAGLLAVMMGNEPAMLSEQFPRRFRVSGHALVLNVGIGFAGGTAPMICIALIRASGNRLAPAAYLIAACIVSAVAALLLKDHSHESA